MHAVIVSGGKQYKVTEGLRLKLEKLPQNIGDNVLFDKVLLVEDGEKIKIGMPFVEGAVVTAEVVDQARHKKIHIVKFRRRKHYLRRQGHRQDYTEVKVTSIQ